MSLLSFWSSPTAGAGEPPPVLVLVSVGVEGLVPATEAVGGSAATAAFFSSPMSVSGAGEPPPVAELCGEVGAAFASEPAAGGTEESTFPGPRLTGALVGAGRPPPWATPPPDSALLPEDVLHGCGGLFGASTP